jgi:hypothetical protein
MKIIAVVSEGNCGGIHTYLAEVTSAELGLITAGDRTYRHSYCVGSTVTVDKHWRRVLEINAAQKNLNTSASSLRAMADLLGTIDVVVPPVPEQPKEEVKL